MKEPVQRLVEQAKAGEVGAFSCLVTMYQDRVLYLAFDLLGNWDDAKDAAQEAFIKAFEKIDTFEGRSHFSTWLYRITVNLCRDFFRRKKRSPVEVMDDEQMEFAGNTAAGADRESLAVLKNLENLELQGQIQEALATLSVNQRTAIVLRYFHDYSTKEIAEIMNCSENTVRIHFFRAMEKLRNHLEKVE